jgi:hypothetical protein
MRLEKMSLPRICACGKRARILDGIVPRCHSCQRQREKELRDIEEGERDLEDAMLRCSKK